MSALTRWTSGFAALGLAAGMTLVGATPAIAAELDVCDTCTYTTIQDAVDAANAGDTVVVAAGTYSEAVTIGKSLTLLGPNSTVSPNSADPLAPSTTRNAEAVIEPAPGAANHAFTVTGANVDVAISGFTVDLEDGVDKQLYLRTASLTDSQLTLTHNLFQNAKAHADGWLMLSGNLGHFTVTATDNRFFNGGVGNGFRVYNSAAEGTGSTELNMQNNVVIDNAGWSLNTSTPAVPTSGTISGNWFGNSTASAPDATNFGSLQSGLVLGGEFENLDLSNNTFKNMTAVSLNLWETISGSLNITGNTFDGYNTAAGGAVISVYQASAGEPGDVSGLTIENNTFKNRVGASPAIINKDGAGTLDVTHNQWDALPEGQMVGPNIEFSPWTVLGEAGKETEGLNAEDGGTVQFNPDVAPSAPSITIPSGTLTDSAHFEYFVRSADDSDLPTTTPFDTEGAILFDLTLVADGVVDGEFTVCVDAPAGMRLWHAVDGEWIDITNEPSPGDVPGTLCGTVTSFSPFAIAEASEGGLAATGVHGDLTTGLLGLVALFVIGGLGLTIASRRVGSRV